MATRLSQGPLQITTLDIPSINYNLQQVRKELDELRGLRGTVALFSSQTVNGDPNTPWTPSPSSVAGFSSTEVAVTIPRGDLQAVSAKITLGNTPAGSVLGDGVTIDVSEANLTHNNIGGLTTGDPHTQYALLAGRSGGQILIGGSAVGDDLTLRSTSGNGNNDDCIIGQVGNNGGTQFFKASINSGFFIGNGTTPGTALAVATSGSTFSGGDWIAWFRHENTVAGNESIIRHQHFSGTGIVTQPIIAGLAARGTNASPTTLSANDYLLVLDGRGYDGSAVNHGEYAVGWSDTAAQIAFRAGGTWSGTDHEAYIGFITTPDASITPSEKLRIEGSGFIGHSATATALGTPIASFHGMASGADYSHVWDNYSGTATTSPALVARRARGTFSSATASQSGDTLFTFQARGHTGSAFTGVMAGINFLATENTSGTNQGTRMLVTGTLTGTATNLTLIEVSGGGSVVIGNQAALATNATDGFLYIPTCAGTPTGVPTAFTGKVAMVYDTTNNILYVYDAGWNAH